MKDEGPVMRDGRPWLGMRRGPIVQALGLAWCAAAVAAGSGGPGLGQHSNTQPWARPGDRLGCWGGARVSVDYCETIVRLRSAFIALVMP